MFPVAEALKKAGWVVATAELGYRAKDPVRTRRRTSAPRWPRSSNGIDENDDVHRVYAALK